MRDFQSSRKLKTGATQTVPDGTQFTRGVGEGNPYSQEKIEGGQPIGELAYALTLETQKYGYIQEVSGLIAPGVDQTVLLQPTTIRNFLLVQNNSAGGGVLIISFGKPATVTPGATGLVIPQGGNILFDAFVPQDEIHLNCLTANCPFVLMYCNVAPFRSS